MGAQDAASERAGANEGGVKEVEEANLGADAGQGEDGKILNTQEIERCKEDGNRADREKVWAKNLDILRAPTASKLMMPKNEETVLPKVIHQGSSSPLPSSSDF